MGTESLPPDESRIVDPSFENGWYLLRRDLLLSSCVYRAGTLVEHFDGAWFVNEERESEATIALSSEMVCKPFYQGVSLYEIHCTGRGALLGRPVLSELPSEKIDPMLVHVPIPNGEGRVCVKFGHCYLPLELFHW